MVGGALDVKNLLSCVYEASEHVVEDSSGWKQAFLDDGYGARQTQLSASRRKHLQLVASPEVGDHKPSVDQVKQCFPRRQQVPAMSKLFGCSAMMAFPVPPRMLALPPPSGVPRGVRLPGPASSSASSLGISPGGGRVSTGGSDFAALRGRGPRTRSEHRLAAVSTSLPSGA